MNRPAIRSRNGNDDDDDDDDDNDNEKDGSKKFDNIVNKWKQTKDKDIVYTNTKDKVAIRKFDIYEIFNEYLNKNIRLAMKK